MGCSISASVGKDGVNIRQDVSIVQELLNGVAPERGGPTPKLAVDGLAWSKTLQAIGRFQEIACGFQWADHRVDPDGKTLAMLCTLGGTQPSGVTATVDSGDTSPHGWTVVDPSSVWGKGVLRTLPLHVPALTRRLVRVTGSSIKWFGVVIPTNYAGGVVLGTPHIFFTPSPHQGGYQDSAYEQFTTWRMLWHDYTSIMGTQVVGSGMRQILVIPFYKNSQQQNLGSFLTNWKEVVSEVITGVIHSLDPLFLRDRFEFDQIFTSSFSNGTWAHWNFHAMGANVAPMTRMAFDIDGSAAKPALKWRADRMVAYRNTPVPGDVNPVGFDWYVGNRWGPVLPLVYPGWIPHALCRLLLMHGLVHFG
jgi:hypothetical protein